MSLDVDLDQIEREKREAEALARAEKIKEKREYLSRYGGKLRPPNVVSVNGKPFKLPEDDEDRQEETARNGSHLPSASAFL